MSDDRFRRAFETAHAGAPPPFTRLWTRARDRARPRIGWTSAVAAAAIVAIALCVPAARDDGELDRLAEIERWSAPSDSLYPLDNRWTAPTDRFLEVTP